MFYFGSALEKEGHLFVERDEKKSMRKTAADLLKLFKAGDRVIVFPEGKASPGAKRLPFKSGAFGAAKKYKKRVQACVIDYLPDRKQLEWDVNKKMLPQLVDLFGRKRIDMSIEFFPSEFVEGDVGEYAQKWHDIIQNKLEENDRDRENNEV